MSSVESDVLCASNHEPATKRQKRSDVKLPRYINRLDGKGFYLRFALRAKNIEEVSDLVSSLYKDRLIDDSYVHVYSRETGNNEGISSVYVSAHGLFHVVSRDYDFNFFRKRIPGASFKTSTYPDKEYPRTIQKETLQMGSIQAGVPCTNNLCASTNMWYTNPAQNCSGTN